MEHLLKIPAVIKNGEICHFTNDSLQNYFLDEMPHLFYFTQYHIIKAVTGKFLNVIATFTWTYMGLFVMICSIGLDSRFKQINKSLLEHKDKVNLYFFYSIYFELYTVQLI